MPRPPSYPRALFVAAFADAGAVGVRLKPGRYSADTVSRIEKRDASLIGIVGRFGRALIAGQRAARRFEDTHDLLPPPPAPPAPRLDPAVAAILAAPRVADLIGAPSHERDDAADSWVELRGEGARRYLNLFWRGDAPMGEASVTGWSGSESETGRVIRQERREPGDRLLDLERMRAAVEAARAALREAGAPPSSFVEIRRVKTSALGIGGGSFEGFVATIGLLPARTREPAWAR